MTQKSGDYPRKQLILLWDFCLCVSWPTLTCAEANRTKNRNVWHVNFESGITVVASGKFDQFRYCKSSITFGSGSDCMT